MATKEIKGFRSLAVTLTTAFLAVASAILLAAVGLELGVNFQSQHESVARQQQLIAQAAADEVKGFIQEKVSELGAAGRLRDLAAVSPAQQQLTLDKLLGLEPAFRRLILLDKQKQALASSSRLSTAGSGRFAAEAGGDPFLNASQQAVSLGSVHYDDITGEPLMTIAVPITDIFNDFQAVLAAELNLKFMWDLVDKIKAGKTGLAYVVNRQGELIAFGDISRVLARENLTRLNTVNRFVKGALSPAAGQANISRGIKGNLVVASYVPLGAPDWAVVVELPLAEAYQPLIGSLLITLASVIVLLILSAAVASYLSKKIAGPIIKLSGAAARIGGGNWDAPIDIAAGDEIGELAESFNQMTARLATAQRELTGHARSLEQKVAERTAELEQAKTVLEQKVSELEQFYQAAIGRELQLIEREKEIDDLLGESGRPPKYHNQV